MKSGPWAESRARVYIAARHVVLPCKVLRPCSLTVARVSPHLHATDTSRTGT